LHFCVAMKVTAVNNIAEIFLYGYIGWDVKASDFMTTLREQEETYKDITLRINSGGGEVFEGLPMYNNIKSSKASITTMVDGLAASMASVIMCAGKKVKAASNAMIMVHGPKGGDFTNVENLETIVEYMKKMKADMAKIYSQKTGKSEEWIITNWLSDGKDHWFTAAEALQAGLIDEVIQSDQESAQSSWAIKRIAAFYDEKLFNSNKPNNPTMKKVIAALNGSKLVQLTEASTEELVADAVTTLSNRLSEKDSAIQLKDAEILRLTAEVEASKTGALKDKATALVEGAIAAKKIVAAQKDLMLKNASASEDGYNMVKGLLDGMTGYTSVIPGLKAEIELPASTSERVKMYDEHAKNGTLKTLSEENIKALWVAKHGKEPKAETLKALSAN